MNSKCDRSFLFLKNWIDQMKVLGKQFWINQEILYNISQLQSMADQQSSKIDKRKALMSFLEVSTTKQSDIVPSKSEIQEGFDQQFTEGTNLCTVCGKAVDTSKSKKNNCGFCMMPACKDHMRKRRVKANKWQKICDACEDKNLFDLYMKLEIKAQESLLVAEQIVGMKHKNLKEVLENKQIKRRELSFTEAKLKQTYASEMQKLEKQDHKLQSTQNKVESVTIQCDQLEEYIKRLENKIKEHYQEDYNILSQQNENLGKQLAREQKKCIEVRNAIEKREKELEGAYEQWERRQYEKNAHSQDHFRGMSSNKQKCTIF